MAKTVAEGFNTFISRLIPLNSEHEVAKKHKGSVESCLNNNFGCYSLFESGSFGAGTGVRHYSDSDFFAAIPNQNLSNNSSYALRKIKEALQYTFPKTQGIEVTCPAVKIPFGKYASETMEVTPCCFDGLVDTQLGKYQKYLIPNCDDEWMYSSPNAHNAYVGKENARLKNDSLKHLIQLLKAWKYYQDVPLVSFYLELRVTKYAEGEASIIYDVDLARVFKYLLDVQLASMRDPMGISGLINATKSASKMAIALSKLNTAYVRALKAIEAKDKGNIDDAFYWWNLLFNYNFPSSK